MPNDIQWRLLGRSTALNTPTIWCEALSHLFPEAMDLQAYSWACGSSIRCIAEPQKQSDSPEAEPEQGLPHGKVVLPAQGLVSVWAAAVRVAADLGDVEDIEAELGPHAAAILSASKFAAGDSDKDSADEDVDAVCEIPQGQETLEREGSREPETKREPAQEPSLKQLVKAQDRQPDKVRQEGAKDSLDGFLGLLSAWSDEAPASRLLEEARNTKTQKAAVPRKVSPRKTETRGAKPLSKDGLAKLRQRFPKSRAPSPPADTRHWRLQDFELYFGAALNLRTTFAQQFRSRDVDRRTSWDARPWSLSFS